METGTYTRGARVSPAGRSALVPAGSTAALPTPKEMEKSISGESNLREVGFWPIGIDEYLIGPYLGTT
jgi:hypothetical protein